MYRKIRSTALVFISLVSVLFARYENVPPNTGFQPFFEEAYTAHPEIPKGLLEGIAYTNTRLRHVQPATEAPSCAGLPAFHGVMGLVSDGKGHFTNNLHIVALLSGYSAQQIMQDARVNILAYADAFAYLMRAGKIDPGQPAQARPVIEALSEIPEPENAVNNYALNAHVYSVLNFLNDAVYQKAFAFPAYDIDLQAVFGAENYRVLSATKVSISDGAIRAGQHRYTPVPVTFSSNDYPPALWNPAASCNYSSRGATPVSAVTIHTIQGSYAGAISWFQNCASSVSAHYVIRSSDGQVTQMVAEADKAWHVGTENPYTIGIEHEGYVDDAAWYTNALYTSVVDLVQDIANSGYGLDLLTTWDGPPTAGLQTLSLNCYRVKGHQHYPNQTHVDPGINWDWDRFYRMLNGTPPTTSLSACSGSFFDQGGSGGNYGDQERHAWHIAPAGATSVTLTFTAFDLETSYDYLYIYDGADANGEYLGRYDGNSIPGPFTANSGEFFLEFRSDCATTRTGWAANWTCNTGPLACGFPDALSLTGLNPFGATLGWNAVGGATSYEVRVRHSLDANWTTWTPATNSQVVTGLKASSLYYWQVRALCGAASSTWNGGQFDTPPAANHTSTLCAGTFRDSGGDLAHYRNNEDYTFTIAPPAAGSVTLNFTAFDLESNFDFLYIHDGNSTSAQLIGQYTGTNSPGTVTSTGGAITVRFVSDSWTTNDGWEATWSCASNLAPTVAISPVDEWYADDFTAAFTDTDNSGSGFKDRFYQVLEYDTAWGANRGNGFVYETFDGGFPNWTLLTGNAYILNDRLHQTDTNSTNTNTYIDVAQDNSGAWLYTFSARLWSGQASKNRRFGLHLFADDPTASQRGNSYLVWFRGDDQQVQIYETVNNALQLKVTQNITLGDFVWYDFKTVYDPATGRIDVFQEDNLVATWTDSSPLTAGSHVSLRSNEAHMDFENVRVWKERGTTVNIKIGPAATEDCRHQSPTPSTWAGQVHTIARDGQDNWSNTDFKQFKIDWTPPSDPSVADGPGADIDTTFSTVDMEANWTSAIDTNSGILRYEYAIGTTAGATDVRGWTDVGITNAVAATGLSLQHNTWYYVTVRAFNLADLMSQEISSDGQLVWSPGTAVAEVLTAVKVWPNPVRDRVWVELPGKGLVELYDLRGKKIFSEQVDHSTNIDLASLSAGVYLLRIEVDGIGLVVERVVKE